MIEWFHPGLIYIFGALLIPVLKGRLKKAYLLLLPTLAFINLLLMSSDVILSEGKTWFLRWAAYRCIHLCWQYLGGSFCR
jgi:multicomponent Na+:H+ antiporter subunit D